MDSETRYHRLFETAQDGILLLDAHTGMITDVNPSLTVLLGYSHAELLGKFLWEIGLRKDIEVCKIRFQELVATQYIRYQDLPLQTKGGVAVSVEFVSHVYRLKTDQVIQCNVRDFRHCKDAELSEQRLRQAQKMEAVGQLAGGLAHDFNNLLGVILGYCEILEQESALPGALRTMVLEIHNAGTSAKNLTQHLLAFSRRQVLQPVVLDLNETVNHVHTMLGRLIGDDVELISVLCPELGTIKADPSQVEQVLMNLTINARDAMPQGGKITIETANVAISEAESRLPPFIPVGRYVRLTVGDTGSGMDLETQSHIFEPFYTTKAPGEGTGLGLSTVFGIVKQSGGTIAVFSKPGEGTKFKIYFRSCAGIPAAMQLGLATPVCRGTETILLVDDSDPLRQVTRRLLENCGYTVLDSGDAAEALRIAAGYPGPLPLLITDVFMPGLSGAVLAEKLALVRPDTKVLFVSGHNDGSTDPLGVRAQDRSFLDKPFTRDDLLSKVRGLLDASPCTLPAHRSYGADGMA